MNLVWIRAAPLRLKTPLGPGMLVPRDLSNVGGNHVPDKGLAATEWCRILGGLGLKSEAYALNSEPLRESEQLGGTH